MPQTGIDPSQVVYVLLHLLLAVRHIFVFRCFTFTGVAVLFFGLILGLLDMSEEEPNVFLFYPNLIGYGRIILAIIACYVMGDSPFTAVLWWV